MVDLRQFCSTDVSRKASRIGLTHPFSRGEWSWATDGHIAIRVPRRADVPENLDAPDPTSWWGQHASMAPTFQPLVSLRLPDPMMQTCKACHGRGFLHDCPECTCVCNTCNGASEVAPNHAVRIGIRLISLRYARLIGSLPGAQIAVDARYPYNIPFLFAGGDGLVVASSLSDDARPVVASLGSTEAAATSTEAEQRKLLGLT